MKTVNLAELPVEEWASPKGKFHVKQKNISLALGGIQDVGPAGGGHPFDVCEVVIPPGKTNWPYHFHCAQWEFFLVKSGTGVVRSSDGETPIRPGDAFLQHPGTPHQIRNTGEDDLVLLIVADNPPCDTVGCPDTGVWFLKPVGKLLAGRESTFYAGEE